MIPVTQLGSRWREEATLLHHRGAEAQAVVLESCADELEVAVRTWEFEMLTLKRAAQESGYSYSTLQQRVADGSIPNVGTKSRPRIRRCDLPKKIRPQGPNVAGEILGVPSLVTP